MSPERARQSLRVRRLTPDDAGDVARHAALSFGRGDGDAAVQRLRPPLEQGQFWGAEDAHGMLVAQCRVTTVGHWFGGRIVPCQHVAGVAVPPEHRGRGAATALMDHVIADGAEHGLGLSLLYPATTRLYRALGYEHAGSYTRYRLDARQAPAIGPAMRPSSSERDWSAVRACYEQAARRRQGAAQRPEERWDDLAASPYRYVLDDDRPGSAGVEAYVLFEHTREPGDWQYTLAVADWAAVTPRGLAALVGFVGRHGTIGKAVTFLGPLPDAWSMLVPEQDVQLADGFFWMARGLDLGAAVAARGFPPGLSGGATLTVEDPALPAQRGPWRLEVDDGRGRLSPAGHADVRLDVRAFGPLFSGFRGPHELALAGLMEGAADTLEWLAAAFAGPVPVLFDFF